MPKYNQYTRSTQKKKEGNINCKMEQKWALNSEATLNVNKTKRTILIGSSIGHKNNDFKIVSFFFQPWNSTPHQSSPNPTSKEKMYLFYLFYLFIIIIIVSSLITKYSI